MTSTSDEVGHTATPWKVYRTTDGLHMLGIGQESTGDGITDPRFGLWCSGAERDANAEFIVNAVNSHDSLVKALEPFAERASYYDETNGDNGPELDSVNVRGITVGDLRRARAALSQAKGGK